MASWTPEEELAEARAFVRSWEDAQGTFPRDDYRWPMVLSAFTRHLPVYLEAIAEHEEQVA